MTAEEMFNNQGFINKSKDKKFIDYIKENDYDDVEEIFFDLEKCTINFNYYLCFEVLDLEINKETALAVCKQIEELGWND